MIPSSATGAWARRIARVTQVSAGLAAALAAPAFAQGPVELSSAPIPENPAWKSYVLGTGEATAKPVRVNATSGDVTNAEGLVDPAKGPARLTYTAGGRVPTAAIRAVCEPICSVSPTTKLATLPSFRFVSPAAAGSDSVVLPGVHRNSRASL